jgi:ABC-type multidrug transport system ATPase subunit
MKRHPVLDNENEKIIQESFNRLAKNRTTLIIAHRLQTIEHAERIIVMSNGKIVEEGTHASLIAKRACTQNFIKLKRSKRRYCNENTEIFRCFLKLFFCYFEAFLAFDWDFVFLLR